MKLSKKQALEILIKTHKEYSADGDFQEEAAALDRAIVALRREPDFKKLAAKGGRRTAKLYAHKLAEWGRRSGAARRKKKAA